MGDRFVLVRLNSGDHRRRAGRQAMANFNAETEMRTELAEVVGKAIENASAAPLTLTDAETDELLDAADLVTRARTAVERDYNGDPAFAHALEMPTRFAKQLVQLVRGGVALGMSREHAMAMAMRAARDTMPPMRLRIAA
ncbi:MAG: ArsR family transcriptional regulator, partial [Pseudonocardiaceae bacterium]|nr:ArsR family transcriptional regulator [Pseudonocardiaceae bacterium]